MLTRKPQGAICKQFCIFNLVLVQVLHMKETVSDLIVISPE